MADTGEKKNKPEDSDFKQQRLKAWQPILTPGWVILTFATVGVVFLAIGIAVLTASNDVVEYTSSAYQGSQPATGACSSAASSSASSCVVKHTIEIDKDMTAPIYMYYQLNNFYQNHRRYVKSRSDVQLRNGDLFEVSGSCEPLATRSCGPSADNKNGTCAVYPCGLIAWSVFNDTFYGHDPATVPTYYSDVADCTTTTSCLTVRRDNTPTAIPWTSSGIAWQSDKDKKFINPSSAMPYGAYTGTPSDGATLALPYENYKYFKCSDTTITNLDTCPHSKRYADVANEEFIVWMRTSGLPDFRKLHRIINQDLKAGDKVDFYINNIFPVTAFEGEKKIVLSTTTWIGGKNQFLGWAYIVVAILCILLAIGFGIKQWHSPREPTTSSELEKAINEGGSD